MSLSELGVVSCHPFSGKIPTEAAKEAAADFIVSNVLF